ncbi:DUF1311 domain-containing protein [Acinetobacter baumannii]|uniref:lysozyme inhibitor LprI family protein n=1 Tax=Acinetobacter baumannii TaxID=470 RepID=UPI0023407B4D|nr:DUF1311 domain-containing protein [Acinetobacter baumannii]MDC4917563.1 DUF1311 domain-containing protein [Acinetobacter baumannii]MDC4932083.1 DUF1311 domain-containing protein [Acinetobacter baumannii]MDH2570040.1 DUF1311 domain-containing protein [Acinetobacter baumannii]
MNKLLSLIFTATMSTGVLANCEIYFNDPTDVAKCYEDESYAKVTSNLKKLKEISKEQLTYNPNVINDLNKSQKAWLLYRDSYCTTYSFYHGERNAHANCIVQLNNDRAKQLKKDIDAN